MSITKPYVSRYTRKQNYQSLNYPPSAIPTHSLSPHQSSIHHLSSTQQDMSAQKRSLQQKQIEDLQQKVDVILEHNDKLSAENKEYKKRLVEFETVGAVNVQKERLSRFQIDDNQYLARKIRSELQIKVRQCEGLACQLDASKESSRKEIDGLRLIISNMSCSNDQLKLDIIKLSQQLQTIRDNCQIDKRMSLKQMERKMQEEIKRNQKQKIQELTREKTNQNRIIEELNNKFEGERNDWQQRKTILVSKLQQNHNKQVNELRNQMISQFNEELRKMEEDANQRCKNQRDKAELFIKQSLEGINQSNQAETEVLKNQIRILQLSLQSRKKLIDELTNMELQKQKDDDAHSFNEVLQIRKRLKEQVQHLLRQNETLKIKTAQKYEGDLKEMVRIYEDRIDILTAQVRHLTNQNQRLRKNYQDELENKIKLRRGWQIEVGQLKNLVRKLKAELQGIQDQFKLNIEGIRDQNATFSMTMMKSMIQDRDKANFFEEQNRKLRLLYDKHEKEVELQKKQAQQKVRYYENKLEHLKRLMEGERLDLTKKQEMLDTQLKERERTIRQHLHKQRSHLQDLMSQVQNQKQQLQRSNIDLRQKCENLQIELKQRNQDIDHLTSKIKENEEHIERLRMQVEMAGVDDSETDDAINNWKQHYEAIILQLQSDKKELKNMQDIQNQKIQKLVYRYRILQQELTKASDVLQKRSLLDRKVMELGCDQNLIKNMGEVFARMKS